MPPPAPRSRPEFPRLERRSAAGASATSSASRFVAGAKGSPSAGSSTRGLRRERRPGSHHVLSRVFSRTIFPRNKRCAGYSVHRKAAGLSRPAGGARGPRSISGSPPRRQRALRHRRDSTTAAAASPCSECPRGVNRLTERNRLLDHLDDAYRRSDNDYIESVGGPGPIWYRGLLVRATGSFPLLPPPRPYRRRWSSHRCRWATGRSSILRCHVKFPLLEPRGRCKPGEWLSCGRRRLGRWCPTRRSPSIPRLTTLRAPCG